MNVVPIEAAVYSLQIASFFLIAGPVMLETERRQTLNLNASWLSARPELLQAHAHVDLRPFRWATAALLALLVAAASTSSRFWMFVVHTVVFFVVCAAFYAYYDRAERRLRAAIPPDPIRRATLAPRRLRAFVPDWQSGTLVLMALAVLGVNAWGYAAGEMQPARALANATFLCASALGIGLLTARTLRRAAYRLSPRTDSRGRSLELSLCLGVAVFFTLVALYHSVGSLGASPLFAHPPTMMHALIEGTEWSYAIFFERAEYRWVELGTALFVALLGPWMARSAFTRSLMAAELGPAGSELDT
jgi:hypothetical protein